MPIAADRAADRPAPGKTPTHHAAIARRRLAGLPRQDMKAQ
ncbi:hypothetical protein [Acetobacter senegalensis]|nr:hypothetical protein [Acetobacter senegalensis]